MTYYCTECHKQCERGCFSLRCPGIPKHYSHTGLFPSDETFDKAVMRPVKFTPAPWKANENDRDTVEGLREALAEAVAERDCLRSQVRAAQPDWPPMPETICLEQAAFREAGMFTQTHCVVTWVIADAHGAPMFRDRIGALICRSDDGELPIGPVKYWHLA